MRHVEQGSVIFVDEHHHLLARLLVNGGYQVGEPDVGIGLGTLATEPRLLPLYDVQQVAIQPLLLHVLAKAHVEVQHGINSPLFLQLLHGEALEQVLPALEIALEGGHEQRLAEPPGAAQEEIRAVGMRHVIDVSRLVYIELILLADALKCLYAYGI